MFDEIRQLSQAIIQNGGSLYDVIELYSTKSLREMKKTFKDLRDRQVQMQEQAQQLELNTMLKIPMQRIPLKDLPLLPRQQLITEKASQSVCVQVLAEANSPLVMSYAGADPGTSVVTFKLNRVNPVAKTYQYPKRW